MAKLRNHRPWFSLIALLVCVGFALALLANATIFQRMLYIHTAKIDGHWSHPDVSFCPGHTDLVVIRILYGRFRSGTFRFPPNRTCVKYYPAVYQIFGETYPSPVFPAYLDIAFRGWFLAIPLALLAWYFWRRWRRGRILHHPNLCLKCSYDLRVHLAGNSSAGPNCPECGTPITIRKDDQPSIGPPPTQDDVTC